jgi:hypothetical protein
MFSVAVGVLVDRMLELRAVLMQRGRRPAVERRQAMAEQWALAQAICGRLAPAVQHELDDCRREVMGHRHEPARRGAAVFLPRGPSGSTSWSDWVMPPEVHADRWMAGDMVHRTLVRRLRTAHIAQKRVVMDALARAGV